MLENELRGGMFSKCTPALGFTTTRGRGGLRSPRAALWPEVRKGIRVENRRAGSYSPSPALLDDLYGSGGSQ